MAMTPKDYERIHNNYDINDSHGALYRGRIENNNDPCGIGRVQVRIATFHGIPGITSSCTPTSTLPWAHVSSLSAGPGRGTAITPLIGDTVWVLFEDNDKDRPVVIGSSYGIGCEIEKEEYKPSRASGKMFTSSNNRTVAKSQKPDRPLFAQSKGDAGQVLYKSVAGAEIAFDDEDNHSTVRIIDRIGQIIELGTDAPAGTMIRPQGDRSRFARLPKDGEDNEWDTSDNASGMSNNSKEFYHIGYLNAQTASSRTTEELFYDSRVYMTEDLVNITNGTSYIHMNKDHVRISNMSPNDFKDQDIVDPINFYSLNPDSKDEDKAVYYWQININGDSLVIRNNRCRLTMTGNTLRLENTFTGDESGENASITRSIIDMSGGNLTIKAPHISLKANVIDLNPEQIPQLQNLIDQVTTSSSNRAHDFKRSDE